MRGWSQLEAMKRRSLPAPLFLLLLLGLAGDEARFGSPLPQAAAIPAASSDGHLPSPDGDGYPLGAGGGSPSTSYLLESLALRAARSLTYLQLPAPAGRASIEGPSSLPQASAYLQGDLESPPVSDS